MLENGADGRRLDDDHLKKAKKRWVKPDDGFRAVHTEGDTKQALGGLSTGTYIAVLAGSSQPAGNPSSLFMYWHWGFPNCLETVMYSWAAGQRNTHPDDHTLSPVLLGHSKLNADRSSQWFSDLNKMRSRSLSAEKTKRKHTGPAPLALQSAAHAVRRFFSNPLAKHT